MTMQPLWSRRFRRPSMETLFLANEGRLIDKWMHYFDIYERHFLPFRGRAPRILEIGVSQGGSIDLWRSWFGRGTRIVGIDIEPRTKELEQPGVEIRIGSQDDADFLREVTGTDGPFDIVIDDGSHEFPHQVLTLETLWPAVADDGIYLVEDLHTSYWEEYGGGPLRPGTFIEWIKPMIDDLHAFHSRTPGFEPTTWTRTVGGIHVYDSIVVLDRTTRQPPTSRMTGRPVFDTVYDRPHDVALTAEHRQQIAQMNRLHRRALRAIRSPRATARRVKSLVTRSDPTVR